MIDVLCVGHACVDMNVHVPVFPHENSKLEIHRYFESGGGPAANAAFLLSTWGVPTAFAGLVGNDARGRQVIDEFEQVGTDLSLLEVRRGYETPFSIVIVHEKNGSRTIINRKQGQAFMDPAPILKSDIHPRVILFDGHEPQASLAALDRYPDAKTVLDAGSLREGTRLLASRMDYLVSSERFALSATGMTRIQDEDEQDRCLAELRKIASGQIVVTLGDRGLVYDQQGSAVRMPAFPVPTVDTTAAGDIFHGAFVYGVLQGFELDRTLRFASAAAALSVQSEGGRQSIPTLEDVQLLLDGERDA